MSDYKVLVSRDLITALLDDPRLVLHMRSEYLAALLAALKQPSDGALTNEGAEPVVLLNTLERFESDGEDFVRLHDVRDVFAMIVRPHP